MKSKRERLKDKAWKTFSTWVRNRDKRCCTCFTGKAENAGHFWHAVLDFDEININGQCVQCNNYNSGNLAEYAIYLIRKYGLKTFFDLYDRKNLAKKGEVRSEQDYQDLIDKYENRT